MRRWPWVGGRLPWGGRSLLYRNGVDKRRSQYPRFDYSRNQGVAACPSPAFLSYRRTAVTRQPDINIVAGIAQVMSESIPSVRKPRRRLALAPHKPTTRPYFNAILQDSYSARATHSPLEYRPTAYHQANLPFQHHQKFA